MWSIKLDYDKCTSFVQNNLDVTSNYAYNNQNKLQRRCIRQNARGELSYSTYLLQTECIINTCIKSNLIHSGSEDLIVTVYLYSGIMVGWCCGQPNLFSCIVRQEVMVLYIVKIQSFVFF